MGANRERERRRRVGEARDAARKRERDEERRRAAAGERWLRLRRTAAPRDVLHEFGVKRRKPSRFRDLLLTIAERRPELLDSRHRDLINHLRHVPWNRRAEDWRPRHRAVDPAAKELLRHLFAVYPVPAFVVRTAIEDRRERQDALRLLRALGRGDSMRGRTPGYFSLWNPTRRMRHLFLRTPACRTISDASLRATVRALGGDDALAAALLETDLFYFLDSDSTEYVFALIRWFIRFGPFTADELETLDNEIWELRKTDPGLSPTGRSPRAIFAAVERRRREERRVDRSIPEFFPASGLRPGAWRLPVWGRPLGEEWTMVEILTRKALIAEGAAMRHCIAGYAEDAAGPDTSIWSLRRDSRRRLTVLVRRDDLTDDGSDRWRIIQASGKTNRNPRPEELAILARWARMNGVEADWVLGAEGLIA